MALRGRRRAAASKPFGDSVPVLGDLKDIEAYSVVRASEHRVNMLSQHEEGWHLHAFINFSQTVFKYEAKATLVGPQHLVYPEEPSPTTWITNGVLPALVKIDDERITEEAKIRHLDSDQVKSAGSQVISVKILVGALPDGLWESYADHSFSVHWE
jgi:hypothetical protein